MIPPSKIAAWFATLSAQDRARVERVEATQQLDALMSLEQRILDENGWHPLEDMHSIDEAYPELIPDLIAAGNRLIAAELAFTN